MIAENVSSTVPGPRPMPVFGARGNLLHFLRDPIAYMRRLHADYGEIAAFARGTKGMTFAFGPRYNQQVLGNPAKFHSAGVTFPGPPHSAQHRLGHSLFRMNNDQHKQQRRLIMPPFHPQAIGAYRDAMVEITGAMLDGWRAGEERDIVRAMKEYSLRVAATTLFGLESRQALALGCEIERWMAMNTSIGVRLLPADRPGTPYRRMLRAADRLEQHVQELIARKRTQPPAPNDVMSLLVHARDENGAGMTDEELVGQLTVLFVAGHETTSNALAWTLFLLAQHPAIMADLHDELRGVLAGAAPTLEQCDRLPLLDRVINESLRLLPPVVYAYRVATEPFQLGPYEMPKGATVAISHYITHHLPDIYSQPERFLPDRWLTIRPSAYAYLPFGAGPRSCVGAGFGLMTMRIALAMILQRYRLTMRPGARVDRRVVITMMPRFGLPMSIHPPDRQFTSVPVRGNIHEMVELPAG